LNTQPSPEFGPEFGKADLSNCEREQINVPGSIQPHGALLVVSEPGLVVVQASGNAAAVLGVDGAVLGAKLADISPALAEALPPHLAGALNELPIAIRCQAGSSRDFDAMVHRPPKGGLVVELERAGPLADPSAALDADITSLVTALSLRALCDEAAVIFKRLTGYDRVMVYRFDEAGHGEVFSEQREPALEAYLGNRYPASDIPQIARRLYERNRVRVLVDVDYTPSPIHPPLSPLSGESLDMSLCSLRSMSPIHIQYLKNMGVGATLVVSLMAGGRLWGLISCHHYVPRMVHFELRSVCELLAETMATRIAALESFSQGMAELSVRRLEQRMIEAMARDGDWRGGLFDRAQAVLQPLNATGAALLFEGQILTTGEVPATSELRAIGAWLDAGPALPVIATASLGQDAPEFATIAQTASGVLAARLSPGGGEYIVWFRPEQVRTVTWGGNPFKPVAIGNDPADLSPRRSFSQWHQLVEGTSEPWSPSDLAAAQMIGDSVADVVLQARALRMLIVQDQLASITRQISGAEHPLIVADKDGTLLLCNEALHRMLPAGHPQLRHIEDIAGILSDHAAVTRRLRDLLASRRTWRGEVVVADGAPAPRTLLVRADPVFSAPGHVLGFVLMFNDISERKAADQARRQFQESVITRRPVVPGLDATTDVKLQKLLSRVVENAQLAALEITDGTQPAGMPALLASIQASVARTATVLARLLWHVDTSRK
jgi:light-regulated signal transduction histidine kinase (bacteriophytochrome)